MAWYLLFACIVIKLGQGITERILEAAKIPKIDLFRQRNHTMSSLINFDFESDLSYTQT